MGVGLQPIKAGVRPSLRQVSAQVDVGFRQVSAQVDVGLQPIKLGVRPTLLPTGPPPAGFTLCAQCASAVGAPTAGSSSDGIHGAPRGSLAVHAIAGASSSEDVQISVHLILGPSDPFFYVPTSQEAK